ncbi:MAG: NIPSNAP family protein [Bryobacteraceae bacterium]
MERRSFMGLMGGIGSLPLAGVVQTSKEAAKTRIYLLETFYLKQGTQPARLNEYLSKAALPALSRVHSGPKIVLEGLVVPHTPQTMLILGFESIQEFWTVRAKLNGDQALERAFADWQAGSEPPFERQDNVLVEAADYSPEIVPLDPPPAAPRIFELRVYHSPTYRQLKALHDRFAGPETALFHKSGIHPVLYGSTVIGPNMPNLTYLTPFSDLAAREKAWNAFGADPEWLKVRTASIEQHGQITAINSILLYRATAYSPIR